MSISFTSAFLQLTDSSTTFTVASLFDLVGEVSGKVPGSHPGDTYLLFSGKMPDGSSTSSIAAEVVNQGINIHDIGASDVGKLLDKDGVFDKRLRSAVSLELFGIAFEDATATQRDQINNKAAFYKSGVDSTGRRVSATSMWDVASHSFVADATGNFRIIAPSGVDALSVFVKSELPALLDNSKISEIDGIPRSELKALFDSKGLDAVKNAINLRSAEIAHFTQLSTTNVNDWTSVDETKINLAKKDQVLLGSWAERQQALFNSAEFKAANNWMGDLFKRIDSIPGASRILKAMGPIGLVTSFLFASNEAAAANSTGNPQRAKDIMAEWAVENAGSEVGASVGVSLGALAIGVAALAGVTIAAPVAAAVIFGSMLAGGLFGGEGGKEFYRLLSDRDGNGKRDIVDKLSNIIFGATSTITTPLPADLNGDKFTLNANWSQAQLIANAKTDIAWRYALRELNAFVISDVSYVAHNSDGSLDLYDKDTNPNGLTEEYLADRAAMLTWKLAFDRLNARDDNDPVIRGGRRKPYNEDWDSNSVQGNWDFIDLGPGRLPGGDPLKLAIDGVGVSLYDHQIVFGSAASDTIEGSGDTDRLYGMAGDDTISGDSGDDYIEGNGGADTISGGKGKDLIKGGSGSDTIDGGDGNDKIYGGADADKLKGGDGADEIYGDGGDDEIYGNDGDNILRGGSGNDKITGGKDQDTIYGEDDDDTLNGGDGIDHIYGGDGKDTIKGGNQADFLFGGDDKDTIDGEDGDDEIHGDAGDDTLNAGAGDDEVHGGSGIDTIDGGEGDDYLYGDGEDDTISGGDGADELFGGAGKDVLKGDSGKDTLEGGSGDDELSGGSGDDELFGGADNDTLDGGADNDKLYGGAGKDKLNGGDGFDRYYTGEGQDTVKDDAAGQGAVFAKDGVAFSGGEKDKGNSWKSSDGSVTYVKAGSGLVIVKNGDAANRVTIENFDFEMAKEQGYLGIVLPDDEDKKKKPNPKPTISPDVNTNFTSGVNWFWRGDPLVLDLDGDGVELTGSSSSVVFDHNADGIKTGSQWVKSDDGMLVRDLNGNGTIDSGRELFGDQTRLTNGSIATNGFAALADLDSNSDGVFNAEDSAFAEVKVWRDLNQDGISQANELNSLDQAGITGINLAANALGQSTFTETVTDAQGVATNISHTVQNVNLSSNNFYREFVDSPAVTATAADLPDIGGSGQVRDLREAMSTGTSQASALVAAVSAFKAAQSPQERQGMLNALVTAWGNTSDMADAVARNPVPVNAPTWYVSSPGQAIANFAAQQPALYQQLTTLERFNGQALIERYARPVNAGYYDAARNQYVPYTYYAVSIESQRLPFFQASVDSIKSTLYENLYQQTEAQSLLDLLTVVVDDKSLRVGFDALNAELATRASANPANAAVNLAEFLHFASGSLTGTGWDGAVQLADLLSANELDAAQTAAMNYIQFHAVGGVSSTTGGNLSGGYGADILVGRGGNDVLSGSNGNDVLIGAAGNDVLYGGVGNDQMVGGVGNDYMAGQLGNDTYFWGKGEGNDTIYDTYADAGKANTVVLRGLKPEDVSVSLANEDDYRTIYLKITETGETLAFTNDNYDYWYGQSSAQVNFIFEDGTQWDMKEAVRQTLPFGTAGDDTLVGTNYDDRADRLAGGQGDDLIIGRDGFDVMEGGAGNDTFYGNADYAQYDRDGMLLATPYWQVSASLGDGDVYVFGKGDGQDTIIDEDYGANTDVLRFKPGISGSDLTIAQRSNDLVVQIKGTTDSVTIKGFFEKNYNWWNSYVGGFKNSIEKFEFSDADAWNFEQIKDASWKGTIANDHFTADARNNAMGGGSGDDSLYGLDGNDVLSGGDGTDILDGGSGDDILDGGAGNDQLFSGSGADTILFGRGDGKDILATDEDPQARWRSYYMGQPFVASGNNVVQLKEGITQDDIRLVRAGNSLKIMIKGTEDVLTVQAFLNEVPDAGPSDANFSLKRIQFADGSSWLPVDILAQILIGDDSSENFVGFSSNETYDGGGGNDTYQSAGGVDTFKFGRGDGHDKVNYRYGTSDSILIFKEGVSQSDVQVRRNGSSAVFTIVDTGESITFEGAFSDYWSSSEGLRTLSAVRFADGSSWTPDIVNALAVVTTAGDDNISTVLSNTPTTLAGGAGDDVLDGRKGETTYKFNRGDGKDSLYESWSNQGRDRIEFGPGIVASDLVVSRSGYDLVIGIAGADDKLILKDSSEYYVEEFVIGGVTFNLSQIQSLIPNPVDQVLFGSISDDVLIGSDQSSLISGYEGNDTLIGNGGDDKLDGGLGDDVLAGGRGRDDLLGGAGNNTYQFGRGDQVDAIQLSTDETAVIQFGAGISRADLSVQLGSRDVYGGALSGNYLVVGIGGNDALTLRAADGNTLDSSSTVPIIFKFADGSEMSLSEVTALVDDGVIGSQYESGSSTTLRGSQIEDYIQTYGRSVFLDGRDNNDYLMGGVEALVAGGAGDDTLYGDRDSVLAGQAGSDNLDSSWGQSATFAFNLGDGSDRIQPRNGDKTLSFGVGIDPSMLRIWLDESNGDLVFSIDGHPDDEIRSNWLQRGLEPNGSDAPVTFVQFIDAAGGYQQFDLRALLKDARFNSDELGGASSADGVAVFTSASEFKKTGTVPVLGGSAAMAYAQTGDLRGSVTIEANADINGNNILFGTTDSDNLDGGAGNDVILANDGQDYLWGGDGDDYLNGQAGDDELNGGAGDDVMYGGSGNDTFNPGAGNDAAYGGAGNDTYNYYRGKGRLHIEDAPDSSSGGEGGYGGYGGDGGYGGSTPTNVLVFGEGITFSDLSFAQDGDNLRIMVAGSPDDVITLSGYNNYTPTFTSAIDQFVFQDGQTVDLTQYFSSGEGHLITAGNGDVNGSNLNDELRGGLGNDDLRGYSGNDRLVGGAGDDSYVFGGYDGDDVIVDSAQSRNIIVFQSWIDPSDVYLDINGGVVKLITPDSTITLEGWNGQSADDAPVAEIIFASGSSLSIAELLARDHTIRGTVGEDVLVGSSGNDVFDALPGNDAMYGGAGSDTYLIRPGSGHDTITDVSVLGEENTLVFTNILNPDQVTLSVDSEGHLVVNLGGGNTVTLVDFTRTAPEGAHTIEFFQFGSNGPTLSYSELLERGFVIDGTSASEVLLTTALHDVVDAGAGNDRIEGSTGSDALSGGAGDDTYEFRMGDGLVAINDLSDATGGNTLRFGPGITRETIERKLRFEEVAGDPASSRFLIVFDENNQISISGFDRTDPLNAPHGIENFAFADGTVLSWNEILDKVFVLEGGDNADTLLGTSRSDRLYGYVGDDTLVAGAGDDVVTGGTGSDQLLGGDGQDNYVFHLGDGQDSISDASVGNHITFGEGIDAGSITVTREGNDLRLNYGVSGDSVLITSTNGSPVAVNTFNEIELNDGTRLDFASFLNRAPEIGVALGDQLGRVGDPLQFALDSNAFNDPDGDPLQWVLVDSNNQPLPAWMVFDPVTRTVSGTPPAGAQGVYDLLAYVVDPSGMAVSQTFKIDVSSNATPTLSADSADLVEDQVVVATGNVLSNDVDADTTDILTVVDTGVKVGQWGTLTLAADGSYQYVLNNGSADVQALKAGVTVVETFAYTATDGTEAVSSQLVVSVTGTNDAPVVSAQSAEIAEDAAASLVGNVLNTASDVDSDNLTVVGAGTLQGQYGQLVLQQNGSYAYTLNNASTEVQSLQQNQRVTDVFSIVVSDGTTTTASQLVIGVNGLNDGPVALSDTAAVAEDLVVVANGNVLSNDKDADSGDVLSVVGSGVKVGQWGTLTLNSNGSYQYVLNNADAEVQKLKAGVTVVDAFSYTVSDGTSQAVAQLVVSVTGTNDAPVVVAQTAEIQEDSNANLVGNVLSTASDVDADSLTVVGAGTLQGQYGQLVLQQNGSYAYTLNNGSSAVQALQKNQRVTDVFAITVSDGTTTTASQLVIGVNGLNDGPVAGNDVAAVTEDVKLSATGTVLANDTDADAGSQLSVTTAGTIVGTYGTLTLLANGSYTYTLGNGANVQALASGQVATESFAYTVSDGLAQATASLMVSVTGQNDGPVATVDAGSVTEDSAVQALGNVLTNDTDVDASTSLVVSTVGTFQGLYGSLVLRADGTYTYSLSNTSTAVQSLAQGEEVTDTFNYSISDGSGTANATAQSNLVISVTGTNDGPVLSQAIADASVVVQSAFSLDLSDTTFRDVDHNDVLGYSLALENGQSVPSWLTFNANGLIVGGTPPLSVAGQTLSLRLTAVDRFGATASDVFQITVTGGQGVTLIGGCGDDRLVGTSFNDTLDGRQGADTMIGGAGDDVYYVDQVANGCEAPDVVTEYLNQGYDKVLASVSYTLAQNVEALQLTGCDNLTGNGNTLDNWIVGNNGSNVLDGKEGNDLITASSGNDSLYGGLGNDILEGQDGNDTLEGGDGIDALFGGAGTDILRSGTGKGLLAGGKGNDTLYAANAATVVSFNKGDGADALYTQGSQKITLSLGGGIRYEDIKVRRSGNDLYFVFNATATDTLRVVNYYGVSASLRPTLGMQVLTEASGAYAPGGTDTLRDNKVEQFDGSRIVADFDTAYKSSSSLKSGNQWAVMGSLLNAHLSSSNTAGIGGDLAYLYGQASGVTGVSMLAANSVLSDSNFASGTQALHSNVTVPSGVARLAG